ATSNAMTTRTAITMPILVRRRRFFIIRYSCRRSLRVGPIRTYCQHTGVTTLFHAFMGGISPCRSISANLHTLWETGTMRFAKWVFVLAGITGIVMIVPPYFLEQQFGRDNPPEVNHPEFYYGFLGVTLAWQCMFLVIATDPKSYRMAMLPAMLEKAGFA